LYKLRNELIEKFNMSEKQAQLKYKEWKKEYFKGVIKI
jgi:hypothetical protein